MTLSNKQYQAMLDLYNELNEAFQALPMKFQDAFFEVLYQRTGQ